MVVEPISGMIESTRFDSKKLRLLLTAPDLETARRAMVSLLLDVDTMLDDLEQYVTDSARQVKDKLDARLDKIECGLAV